MQYCVIILLTLIVGSSQISAAGLKEYLYTWKPHIGDLSNEKELTVLRSLLKLVATRTYVVRPGESLDFIVRKTFLVSGRWHSAYEIYLARIKELNPNMSDVDSLQIDQRLLLPVGPQYGATELQNGVITGKLRDFVFRRLSTKAYATSRLESIQSHAVATLSHFVSWSKKGSGKSLFESIKERGLVAAIDTSAHPEEAITQIQSLSLRPHTKDQTDAFKQLVDAEKDGNLLPGLFPVAKSVAVPCADCTSCADVLNIPKGVDVSRARLLIEDTGVDPQILPTSDQFLPVQASSDGLVDLSKEKHGTFVLSEIVELGLPGKKTGPFPRENVFVSRVAAVQDGELQFRMSDIVAGWQQFSAKMSRDRRAPNTLVVNLSAQGEPPPDTNPSPSLPRQGSNLLIVAAAGNDGNAHKAQDEAFGRLSGGGNNLLVVGALGTNGQITSYSNFHDLNVQLFARGDCICGATNQINGTSQAAPLIATAAALLASARPEWFPRQVMWRLIATADPLPAGEAFGGTVNLMHALDRHILMTVNNDKQPLAATSIQFNENWGNTLIDNEKIISSDFRILRLHVSRKSVNQVCYTFMRFLLFDHKELCVPTSDTVTIITDRGSQDFQASQVTDIQLPLNEDRSSQLPRITVKGAQ